MRGSRLLLLRLLVAVLLLTLCVQIYFSHQVDVNGIWRSSQELYWQNLDRIKGLHSGNRATTDANVTTTPNNSSSSSETALDGLKKKVFESAGNSTLGFYRVEYINLPSRYDSDDAIFLQCMTSNITVNKTEAVIADTLEDKGLPPSDRPKELQPGEKACFRSHTNLWRRMINEGWPSLLILEADAAWDVNIRDINYRIAEGLDELIKKFNFSEVPGTGPSEHDPFNIQNWDVISFGSCKDGKKHHDKNVIIQDPDSPIGAEYWGRNLTDERVVRKAGNMVCTNSYAVSQRGAIKLLLRSVLYTGQPVDVAMGDMIRDDDLIAYSVYPPTFAQWTYKDGLGGEGLNSNIRNSGGKKDIKKEEFIDNWAKAKASKDVWSLNPLFKDAQFRHGALQAVADKAYGQKTIQSVWEKAYHREIKKGEREFKIEEDKKKKEEEKKKKEEEKKKKEEEEKKKKEEEEKKKKEEEEKKKKEEEEKKKQEEEEKKKQEEEEKKKQEEEEEKKRLEEDERTSEM
ncbi:hypothetical protein TRICI_003093 [Trichomonascus ciferrii]|uniref:Glycosyl transferase family 25 domain-containing protein n=1 Tax=Trichomonascus ciferrii TaxID=44093 RepID=A0A642V4W4_9ASCO|nr:hypothetical protein TRICI_003093 [Trichomonascus ciferrii]